VRQGDCPACRDRRGFVVLVQAHENAEGAVVPGEPEPEPCARCGAIPERVVQIVEVVVTSHKEAATLQASQV
jgi:hypothetical protein